MRDDFELIVHKLGRDSQHIDIYPMCEPHIGSPYFREDLFDRWLTLVKSNPNGYIVSSGDDLDVALKGSKTNSYDAKMRPSEQKAFLVRKLMPVRDRILGVCQGNHEFRATDVADDCPLYDAMAKMDIEDVYRSNMAFIKVSIGERNKERQVAYTIVLAHGGTRNKVNNFSYAIDNMDIMVSGHTHTAESTFPAKYVIDVHNEVVRKQGFKRVVVPSFQDGKGYALKGMYMPQDNTMIPVIRLDGTVKDIEVSWKEI